MEMRNRMYKHENIAEIKILLNPFSCDSKKQHRAANPPSIQPPPLLPAALGRTMLVERVINLRAKVSHGYTSRCMEEGLGFQLSRFCP